MTAYSFEVVQDRTFGKCFVYTRRNGVLIDINQFKTLEWALFFKRTCESLHAVVTTPQYIMLQGYTDGAVSSNVYTKAEVDALLLRITSLEHWLAPLRARARRFFELLMWGERGRFSKT